MKTELYPIILNGTNVISSDNSTYRYEFPRGSVLFNDSKVAVASVGMYYSWFNISAAYGNNTFSYVFPTLAGSTTVSITLPDGYYEISTINEYLQSSFVSNGFYLVNGSGDNVYYLEIVTNSTYYSIQENSYPVPTALPVGYTNPAAMTFPAVASTPLLVISGGIGSIIGFADGSFPSVAQATVYSKLSTTVPQVTPVSSVILSCTLLNNRFSIPNTVLYSFSPAGTAFGALIQSNPSEFSFVSVQDGNYSSFDIVFLDQEYNRIAINDANLVVQLLIETNDATF